MAFLSSFSSLTSTFPSTAASKDTTHVPDAKKEKTPEAVAPKKDKKKGKETGKKVAVSGDVLTIRGPSSSLGVLLARGAAAMAGREVVVEEVEGEGTFLVREQAVELVEPVAAALYILGDRLEVPPSSLLQY